MSTDKAMVTASEAPPPTQSSSESDALISMIERAARDPAIDIDKMERLFLMRERMMERHAQEAFSAAMAVAQARVPTVVKRLTNTHTKSNYADLAAIADAALPIIHDAGFGLSFSEFKSEMPDCLGIACKVTHAAGHSETYQFHVPIDGAGMKGTTNKTATQAYGSTFTYGRRYATCGVFNIATRDDDGNAAKKEDTEEQRQAKIAKLRQLIDDTGADTGWICQHHSVESIDDMNGKDLDTSRPLWRHAVARWRRRQPMDDIVEQGSAAWHKMRVGKVTASRVADVVRKTRSGISASRSRYMGELIVERLTGAPNDSFKSADMQHGSDNEAGARDAYAVYSGSRLPWCPSLTIRA